MNKIHISSADHRAITDVLGDIHIRLDNIQGAIECIAEAARQTEKYPASVTRALHLIAADVAVMVGTVSELSDDIRIAE